MEDLSRRQVLKIATVAGVVSSSGAAALPTTPSAAVKFQLFVGKNCFVKEGPNLHTATMVADYKDVDVFAPGPPTLHFGLRFGHRAQILIPSTDLLEVQIHALRVDNEVGGGKKRKRLYKVKANGDVESENDDHVLALETFVYPVYTVSDPAPGCCVTCGDTTVCGPKNSTCIYCDGVWICC
jgi:hypothetical protein